MSVIIPIDAERVFDNMQRTFLTETLRKLGIDEKILSLNKAKQKA